MLQVKNLTFSYDNPCKAVLEDISFDLPPGRIALVTGLSGSGKSTLLHCINGLAVHYYGGRLQGEIWIGGRGTAENALWQTSELAGTLFQNPNTQFFQLTVEDEIVFGLEYAQADPVMIETRLDRALRTTGIEHLRHRDLFSLSSGEKQKVALACLVAMEQPLLLLDEPTANLDVGAIHDLKTILADLKKQGRTILISEHRLWYLRELVDQVIVLDHGRIVYQGLPSALESEAFRRQHGLRIWNRAPETTPLQASGPDGQSGLLIADRLRVLADRKEILNNISLSLLSGQCIALMGHNGAGKTTLARTLTGLQKETKGVICIKGSPVKSKDRIGRIACVTQQADQQLFSDTVAGELQMQSQISGCPDFQTEMLLRRFDLTSLKDHHPQTLSGGEKQRLAIAASMVMNSDILILDEPTSGMDHRRMTGLIAEIEALCRRGWLTLIITHDMELVSRVCHQVLWMENGTIRNTYGRSQFNELFTQMMLNRTERVSL